MNKGVQIPFWDSDFISLWHIPRSGVAVSQGISVFNFLQNFCNIFHNDYVCLVAKSCQTLVTPWTVAHLALLSVGFSRQEYWSGLPFSSVGDLLNSGTKPFIGRRVLYHWVTWETVHNDCTYLHSHHLCKWFPFLHTLINTCYPCF